MRAVPHVIDHDEQISICQEFAEPSRCGFEGGEARPDATQDMDEIFESLNKIPGGFSKGHPKDSIVKGFLDRLGMADRRGNRRFTVSTCSNNDHGLRNRFFRPRIAKKVGQFAELDRTEHEVFRQIFRHKRDSGCLTTILEVTNEFLPLVLLLWTIDVNVPQPTRHARQIEIDRPPNRVDANSLLPSVAPFLLDHIGGKSSRRNNQRHELDLIEGFRYLKPPITSAFHTRSVLPDM